MSDPLAPLWEPIEIGGVEIPNRILVSAHQTHFSLEEHNLIGDRYIAYMEERARGGAGLLVTEAGGVHPSTAREGLIDLYRPEILPGLKRLGVAVQSQGSRLFAQLSHMGNQDPGTSLLDEWHPVVAPSPLPSVVYGRVAKEMDAADIAAVVAGYGEAASNAEAAGLDGAEISAGHGYLVCQFLSPMTNHRTDEYGGSTENRCRFAIEIAAEVNRRTGGDFPLGIRLSFDEYVGDAGITGAMSEEIVRVLDGTGHFAFFSITAGNYHSQREWVPSMSGGRDAHLAPDAARAKEAIDSRVPVMVAAAIRTIDRAAEIVATGRADMVAMTRAHIADPRIVEKAREGRVGEIRRCVGANQGCLRRLFEHEMITCTVNPTAGRELTLGAPVAEGGGRRVLVVGGGPAGMKLAETAALGGHAVTLIERGERLGGALLAAGRLPNRGNWIEMADDLAGAVSRAGVEVRLGVDAGVDTVAGFAADDVFIATGAVFDRSGYSISAPHRESIPGAELDLVIDPVQAIEDPESCGERVVIVDDNGDHLPLGLALLLTEAGKEVEVVSTRLFAGNGLIVTGDLPWLYPRLIEEGVKVSGQEIPEQIQPGSISMTSIWGGVGRTIPAETVVLSMMRRSESSLSRELAAAGIPATMIGDSVAPREVDDATHDGLVHARHLNL